MVIFGQEFSIWEEVKNINIFQEVRINTRRVQKYLYYISKRNIENILDYSRIVYLPDDTDSTLSEIKL